jgi:stage II sporulation protein AA (anti-sigma F factor antagonist)
MATDEVHDGQVPGLQIAVLGTHDPNQVCVRLKGELDIAGVPVARDRIAKLKRRGGHLVLDLRKLTFIDGSGLNLVLGLAAESTRDGWDLSVIPGASLVQRIFQLSGTRERLPLRAPNTNGKHLVK